MYVKELTGLFERLEVQVEVILYANSDKSKREQQERSLYNQILKIRIAVDSIKIIICRTV